MARSVILKARVSPAEYDALVAQLKPPQTLSDMIRGALGIDGKGQLPPTANLGKIVPRLTGSFVPVKKPCPVTRFCPMRKGRYCTSRYYTPACHLGAEAWELL